MSQEKLRVAVVMGGISTEHEVSINSGKNVCNSLPRDCFEVKPVVITLEGRWLLYPGLLSEGEVFGGMPEVEPADAGAALSCLIRERIDCVFVALHGPGGEDGTLQGFFETAGIPYTGSGVLGNAVGMDKIIAKQVMLQVGIPTAPFIYAGIEELQRDLPGFISAVEEKFGYPCVAKVANQGSSHNLGIAGDRSELETWLEKLIKAGDYALVEEYLRGQELTCAVIEKPGGGGPLPLPPTELVPLTSSFFDYHAKYTPGATDEITPARISPEVTARVQDLALRTHKALRCGGMTRTDMIKRGDDLFVLEINTIPGMTDTSLVPQAAAVAGISFPDLLEMQVLWAIEMRGRR